MAYPRAYRTWAHRRERRKAKQTAYRRAPKGKKGGHATHDYQQGAWVGKETLRDRLKWSPKAY